jgi:glycosyltransferase involved in cell wall biosynthesis
LNTEPPNQMPDKTQVIPERSSSRRAGQAFPVVALGTDHWNAARHQNGVVSYTTHLVEGMRQLGARVYVVANNVDPGGNGDRHFVRPVPTWAEIRRGKLGRVLVGIGRRLVPDYTGGRLLAERLLSVLHRAHRDDGIQIFETEESCGVARLVIPRSPVPVVVRLHGPWFLVGPASDERQDAAFRRRVARERIAIERAAGISAPSRDVIARTEDFYGIQLASACVIPNPIQPVPDALRWTLSGCDQSRLLFVGRFDRGKGADILLDAFARVVREDPRARLTLVGRDHGIADANGTLVGVQDYIRKAFPEPAVQSRIEWLGLRSADELIELRRRSFACVVASRYESFSMVTLEAMASGCPIVAPNVGGVPELVRHERNGLLFRSGDPGDLARTLLRLMHRLDMAQSLGEQAVRDATAQFNPACIARRTLNLYREVLQA